MSGYVRNLAVAARQAQSVIAACSGAQRSALLEDMATQLLEGHASILSANALDMQAARSNGASNATLDRLLLDAARVQGMANALREVAAQPDPLGQITRSDTRPNGVQVQRQRIPLGLIAMIFEARPNVCLLYTSRCV